jgi:DNA-binding transcriptional LysR family regulator
MTMDLNLLAVFRAVEETRHVTRAAKQLGVTQPALSQALRRLREELGDPLFLRTPRGMVLTPLAESIAVPIRETLTRIEHEVIERGPFRPATLERTFRLRSTDYLESLLSAPLVDALATEAPHVRFSLVAVGVELPKEELESGTCDLAIAGFFGELPDGFHQQVLFSDSFACAVSHQHPRIRRPVDLDAFCAERHILVAPSGDLSGAVDRALAKRHRSRKVVVGASGFMAGGWLAARSEAILTAPSRLLQLLAEPFGLVTFPSPIELSPIKIAQVWHARNHQDAAHRWFRDLVKRTLAQS